MDFLLELVNPWGYVLVFVLGLAEGAALIGLFLPGETAMILGGVLVSQGRATLGGILLAGCIGSALGDSIGYWIGRRFGRALRESRLGRKVGEERWMRARAYLTQKGAKAIFFGRFLGFLRTLVPPLAGSTDMPYRRFVAFNAPAAALWAAVFISIGVAAGESWHVIEKWAGRASLVLLILVIVGIGLFVAGRALRSRVERMRATGSDWLERPGVRRFRERFRPQLDFLRRRLDPAERFGLFLTVGGLVCLGSAVALGAIVDSLAEGGDVARFDASLLAFFADHRATELERLMRGAATAGEDVWSAALLVLAFTAAAVTTRRLGWVVVGAVLIGGGLVLDDAVRGLLDLVGAAPNGRARDKAFPSSELTIGAVATGGLVYVVGRSRSWTMSIVVGTLALFFLAVVGIALMYLGRQAPSAIAGGFFLGAMWAAIGVTSSSQLPHLWRSRPSRAADA